MHSLLQKRIVACKRNPDCMSPTINPILRSRFQAIDELKHQEAQSQHLTCLLSSAQSWCTPIKIESTKSLTCHFAEL